MAEHWVTSMEEIRERLCWIFTRTKYEDGIFRVWARDYDDRPIYLRHQGIPVNWAQFDLATPRDVELAKILHLDWSLKEGNPLDDLLTILENGGFPNGSGNNIETRQEQAQATGRNPTTQAAKGS